MKKFFTLIVTLTLMCSVFVACSLLPFTSEDEESNDYGSESTTVEEVSLFDLFEVILNPLRRAVENQIIFDDWLIDELFEYFRGLPSGLPSVGIRELLLDEMVRLSANQQPPYTEEQLQALGRVMVGGNLLMFGLYSSQDGGSSGIGNVGVLTFVDSDLRFAALAHIEDELREVNDRWVANIPLASINESGFEIGNLFAEEPVGYLKDESLFTTVDGLFGRFSEFYYDTSREMVFGLPQPGAAQIWLVMPDNRSGWYEIIIHENKRVVCEDPECGSHGHLLLAFSRGTHDFDFFFSFTDARLPEWFNSVPHPGRSGAPIIQRGRLVGGLSGGITCIREMGANLAADMRFAQLQRYDENFNAELFRNVPTLQDYFD